MDGPAAAVGTREDLLERAPFLEALADDLAAVAETGRGRLILLTGEAGVGKTALLRRFCGEAGDSGRILWGACDALATPRALGPLVDVAEQTGGPLQALVGREAIPRDVVTALFAELRRAPHSVLVLEDGWKGHVGSGREGA